LRASSPGRTLEKALTKSIKKKSKAGLTSKIKTIEKMECKTNLVKHGLNRTDQYQHSWSCTSL
jgi:hypothetical protein